MPKLPRTLTDLNAALKAQGPPFTIWRTFHRKRIGGHARYPLYTPHSTVDGTVVPGAYTTSNIKDMLTQLTSKKLATFTSQETV
jgi:hypothetical protein